MKYFSDINWLWSAGCAINDENQLHPSIKPRGIIRQFWFEGALLWKYAKLTKGDIVEIGRRHGGTLVLLLEATSGSKRVITSIDIEPFDEMKKRLASAQEMASCGVSCDLALTSRVLEVLKKEEDRLHVVVGESRDTIISHNYDLLFIDGEHNYEGVSGDTKAHWNKLKKGGFALYHDYGHSRLASVQKFCDEWEALGKMKKIETAGTLAVFEKIADIS